MISPSLYEKQILEKHVHLDCLFGPVTGYEWRYLNLVRRHAKTGLAFSPGQKAPRTLSENYFEMGIK
ncbi:MAG: hypothetical protein HOF76_00545 [Candidatus Scalindua sp.]|jgi:hypothetical protein|nr:hypothetical protein [Candidatus Scalindua sp.]MBT5303765.1 hypothetical protein [Candidatus Scalindua sp.]MBT7212106.1 hypothetical protein [Candidatus Scalindua sp.]MBT7590973.1 hypothetical protein [Candidatus Scalindua sp.]